MVDFFGSDRMLHTCQLEVQWEGEGAVQEPLQLKLTLKGAKEPFTFLTLICGERGMHVRTGFDTIILISYKSFTKM